MPAARAPFFWGILALLVVTAAAAGIASNTAVYLPVISAPAPPPPAGCNTCTHDAYNCSDFPNQPAAQACFVYCLDMVGIDIHRLDGDNDGIACELLPGAYPLVNFTN